MKKFLVPTDLSSYSLKALGYALDMAAEHGGMIYLTNVYFLADVDARGPVLKEMYDCIYSFREKKNIRIVTGEENQAWDENPDEVKGDDPVVYCQLIVRQGFVEEEIINTSVQKDVDLIIMGTHGSSGFGNWFFGSSTVDVIKKSELPVMAIPPKATFQPVTEVAYATDMMEEQDPNLKQLIKFVKYWDAKLQMIHIRLPDTAFNIDHVQSLAEEIQEDHNLEDVPFIELESDDIISGLMTYISDYSPSVLAMTTRHRTFLQQLTESSKTSRMALEGNVPVLAFHR